MANEFQRDYESLQLAKDANWSDAQSSYRKLVNRWHPDRYTNRPRELANAQKQFIDLTKSFNNLRSFYQTNNRLPFETKRAASPSSSVPNKQQRVETGNGSIPDLDILNKRKYTGESPRPKKARSLFWPAAVALLMVASLTVMFAMDNHLKQQNLEQARQAYKESRPSEFSPNAKDIRRQSNRGAIMNNTAQGKLGDQLMRDVFR